MPGYDIRNLQRTDGDGAVHTYKQLRVRAVLSELPPVPVGFLGISPRSDATVRKDTVAAIINELLSIQKKKTKGFDRVDIFLGHSLEYHNHEAEYHMVVKAEGVSGQNAVVEQVISEDSNRNLCLRKTLAWLVLHKEALALMLEPNAREEWQEIVPHLDLEDLVKISSSEIYSRFQKLNWIPPAIMKEIKRVLNTDVNHVDCVERKLELVYCQELHSVLGSLPEGTVSYNIKNILGQGIADDICRKIRDVLKEIIFYPVIYEEMSSSMAVHETIESIKDFFNNHCYGYNSTTSRGNYRILCCNDLEENEHKREQRNDSKDAIDKDSPREEVISYEDVKKQIDAAYNSDGLNPSFRAHVNAMAADFVQRMSPSELTPAEVKERLMKASIAYILHELALFLQVNPKRDYGAWNTFVYPGGPFKPLFDARRLLPTSCWEHWCEIELKESRSNSPEKQPEKIPTRIAKVKDKVEVDIKQPKPSLPKTSIVKPGNTSRRNRTGSVLVDAPPDDPIKFDTAIYDMLKSLQASLGIILGLEAMIDILSVFMRHSADLGEITRLQQVVETRIERNGFSKTAELHCQIVKLSLEKRAEFARQESVKSPTPPLSPPPSLSRNSQDEETKSLPYTYRK